MEWSDLLLVLVIAIYAGAGYACYWTGRVDQYAEPGKTIPPLVRRVFRHHLEKHKGTQDGGE